MGKEKQELTLYERGIVSNHGLGVRVDDKTLKATQPELFGRGWRPVQGFAVVRLGSGGRKLVAVEPYTGPTSAIWPNSRANYVWLRKWRKNSRRWTRRQRYSRDDVTRATCPMDNALLRHALRYGFDERGEFLEGRFPER